MNSENEEKAAVRSVDNSFDKLRKAMETARYELESVVCHIKAEDLGEIYVAGYEDGLYISAIRGNVEFGDGWEISYNDMAQKISGNIEDAECAKTIAAGFREIAKKIEKDHGPF